MGAPAVDTLYRAAQDTLLIANHAARLVQPAVQPLRHPSVPGAGLGNHWFGLAASLLSGLIGAFLASLDARSRRHHTALVRLELSFNRTLNRLSDNRFHIRGALKSIDIGAVHRGWPAPVDFDGSAFDDLASLDLINALLGYVTLVEKVNRDIANVHAGYAQMTDALLRQTIDLRVFQLNSEHLQEPLRTIDGAYALLQEQTKTLLSTVRVMARRDLPPSSRLTLALLRSRMPRAIDVQRERAVLDGEIAHTQENSAAEIATIRESAHLT